MRFHSIPVRALSLSAALLVIPDAPLRAQTRDSELEALREQIRQLDQQLRVLERKQEIRDEDAATRAKAAPVLASGASGFSLTSGDKAFQLRLRGNIHADARFFINDNVSGNDTFLLRRVRPSFEGTLYQKFGFRIMPDLAGSTFSLLDGYATYNHSAAFNVLVGKSKTPFDLERLVSQTDLLFIERSYPTSLGPNRDIGVQIYGDVVGGKLTYQLAWVNGVPDGGSSTGDTNDDKEIAARLFAHPFKGTDSPLAGLGIGIAATTTANNSGTPAGYRTNAQQTFFSWRSGVANVGEHTRIEPQAYYYTGPLGLIGSWASSEQELALGTSSATLRNTAWSLAAHYVLTGEAAGYRGVTPKQSFSLADGTWGAFEVAARHGELAIDRDAFPIFANPAASARKVSSTTLGLNWYLNRAVKASLNYEYSDFTGGESGTVTRTDEHAILSRLQLRY
jgi:phosphate-selective porin OprO and OprP